MFKKDNLLCKTAASCLQSLPPLGFRLALCKVQEMVTQLNIPVFKSKANPMEQSKQSLMNLLKSSVLKVDQLGLFIPRSRDTPAAALTACSWRSFQAVLLHNLFSVFSGASAHHTQEMLTYSSMNRAWPQISSSGNIKG